MSIYFKTYKPFWLVLNPTIRTSFSQIEVEVFLFTLLNRQKIQFSLLRYTSVVCKTNNKSKVPKISIGMLILFKLSHYVSWIISLKSSLSTK